jgi:hypothetical protein
MEKLEWSALEYDEKERGSDWFWALGIIVVCGSVASIIYGNYFFAVILILGGVLLRFFATKKPEMVSYELNSKGLKINNQLFPYENIKSFFVQTESPDGKGEVRPMLFIHSQRFFLPIISIPIDIDMAENIRSLILEKEVAEEKMQEHTSEKIMNSLGF